MIKLLSWGYRALVWTLTKNSYEFLNFSDRPFNGCDFLKSNFAYRDSLTRFSTLAFFRQTVPLVALIHWLKQF
jgi:hypothetical protein